MQNINHSLLRWQCRRGLLELDILLGDFLDTCYNYLSDEQKTQFQELLTCHDQDILAWLMGYMTPQEPSLKMIIQTIRESLIK